MAHSSCRCAPRRRRYADQSGLSLVEVVVAAGLLALGLLPVAYIQSSGLRSGSASYGMLAASALAMQLSDEALAIPYTDTRMAATGNVYVAPASSLSATNPLAPDGTNWPACASPKTCGFTRTWQITDNMPIPNTKRIDIQVEWNEYGVTRTYTLSTIRAVNVQSSS